MTMMKLKHSENKWNVERERRQLLEEENEKLRTEIAVLGNVQPRRLFWQQQGSGECKFYIFILAYFHICFLIVT